MIGDQRREPAYRFGLFEVFPDSGELWKHGHHIKIQDQPFRLLVALLEQPGQLVSRELIRDRLWPENTFVEFDQSLGTAVTKLRQALGDEADNPRFIETVPRRGYRFLAPVTVVAGASKRDPIAAGAPTDFHGAIAEPATGAPPIEAKPAVSRSHNRRWLFAVCALVAVCLLAVTAVYRRLHPEPKLHANDSVILATIQNGTGEAIFDDTLYQAMRVKLNESPFFNVVPERTVRAALTKLNRNVGDPLSADDARLACTELKAQAVISGTIASARGGYEVTLTALPCGAGSVLASEQSSASSQEEVLGALGVVSDGLRRKLGEQQESVQRFGTPLAQATTSSLAALQAFSTAEDKHNRGNDSEVAAEYKLATDLDPNFAIAYARLGVLHANANEQNQSVIEYQKAFDLREHSTERERLLITAHYYEAVHGELEKAIEVYTLWLQLYPHDFVPANNLADDYIALGHPEKALEYARESIALNPNNAFPYSNFMQASQRLGYFAQTKKAFTDASQQHLDHIGFHMALFQVAFAENDEAAMQRQFDWARGDEREGELLNLMAWSKAARGQLRAARDFFHQAEDVAMKNGLTEYAADVAEDDAQFEVDFGFAPEGRSQTERALKLAPNEINVLAFASLIFARAGDIHRAEDYLSQADKLGPRYTIYQKMVLPTSRGVIQLYRNDPGAAIQEMTVVAPYDLNRPMEMCGIYYRAQAMFAAHQYKEAAQEFQRLIDHSSIRPVSPYLVLAHLGIARALRAAGDVSGARQQYATFFELWKGADPDIPLVQQARAEAARL